jgi:hypothetical protein
MTNPTSIHHFRTAQYRVFLAEPYFKLDLEREIKWHEEHVRKLKLMAKNPKLFHSARTSHEIDQHRERHFQEHVIDSIPFHEKILNDNKARLKTILELVPERTYRKLHSLCVKHDASPDYFVFDRLANRFFFVIEKPTPGKEDWSRVVEKKSLAEVMFLR